LAKVVFITRVPDGIVVKQDTVTLSLSAGDSIETPYSFGVASSNIGVWRTNYTLLSETDEVVQKERLGQCFVVSNPAGVAKTPDITFSVQQKNNLYNTDILRRQALGAIFK
jgi:hypothetical protein